MWKWLCRNDGGTFFKNLRWQAEESHRGHQSVLAPIPSFSLPGQIRWNSNFWTAAFTAKLCQLHQLQWAERNITNRTWGDGNRSRSIYRNTISDHDFGKNNEIFLSIAGLHTETRIGYLYQTSCNGKVNWFVHTRAQGSGVCRVWRHSD